MRRASEFKHRQELLTEAAEKYLRKTGWNHRCDNPGSYWLWEKDIGEGRVILTDTKTAMSIQESLERGY